MLSSIKLMSFARFFLAAAQLALPASACFAYDPLTTGPAPTVTDLTADAPGNRQLPLRIFLPQDSGTPGEPAPVILFSHGLGGSREGSNFLGEHWSARGYVTVFIQHPGSDAGIWQGKRPAEIRRAMQAAASGENYRLRIQDVDTVLDFLESAHTATASPLYGRLDLARIGMAGHSFGAKTTQAVAGEQTGLPGRPSSFADPRIKAALPMSPSPSPRLDPAVSFAQVTLPWLLMTGTEDAAPSFITNTSPNDRRAVFPALPPGGKYELVLNGGHHHAFTEREVRRAPPRNPNHHRLILASSTAFWDAYLRDDADALSWLNSGIHDLLEPGDTWQAK